jgi:hypothetical protein
MNELIIIRPSGGNKPANAEGKMVIVRLLIILRVVRVGLAQGRCGKSTKRKCQTKGEWVTIQQLVQKCPDDAIERETRRHRLESRRYRGGASERACTAHDGGAASFESIMTTRCRRRNEREND